MEKRGSVKVIASIALLLVIILVTGVLTSASNSSEENEAINDSSENENKKDSSVPESVQGYVEDFAQNNGIALEKIKDVSKVDFDSLPKEVNIENIDDANLEIYQINYTKESGQTDKLFVITYGVQELKAQGDLIIAQDKREFLNFGFNKESQKSVFLDTSTGVESNLETGYVMMRDGSITGLSTSIEALEGNGNVEVIIYVNGKQAQFGNSFVIDSSGVKKDYDTQSKGTVSFKKGDVISLYLKSDEGIAWKNDVTLLEITTND